MEVIEIQKFENGPLVHNVVHLERVQCPDF